MAIWDDIVPREDQEIYSRAGYIQKQTFGTKPALLIVDVVLSFAGSQGKTLKDAIAEFRTACGEAAWQAIPHIRTLLDACRRARIPVIYTKSDLHYVSLMGGSTKSSPPGRVCKENEQQILPEIAPQANELIVSKVKASAFFATPLDHYLQLQSVDTLLICGTTTSGCVRATTVDAFSRGYRTFLVQEACFDRSMFSHKVSLFEMNAKYADVITLEEALKRIQSIAA